MENINILINIIIKKVFFLLSVVIKKDVFIFIINGYYQDIQIFVIVIIYLLLK